MHAQCTHGGKDQQAHLYCQEGDEMERRALEGATIPLPDYKLDVSRAGFIYREVAWTL